jgi:effector-binding domain-containing protein
MRMKLRQFPPEIGAPGIDQRAAKHTVGIRMITPFEGMFAQTDRLFKELRQWVNGHGLADHGPYFLRYHVIDMQGLMDVEAGFVVPTPQTEDERIKAGVLPGGRYANLTYSRYALRGNQALLLWIKEQALQADTQPTPTGEAFGPYVLIYSETHDEHQFDDEQGA